MKLNLPCQITSDQVKEALFSVSPLAVHDRNEVLPYEEWLKCPYARFLKEVLNKKNDGDGGNDAKLLLKYKNILGKRDACLYEYGAKVWDARKHYYGMLR